MDMYSFKTAKFLMTVVGVAAAAAAAMMMMHHHHYHPHASTRRIRKIENIKGMCALLIRPRATNKTHRSQSLLFCYLLQPCPSKRWSLYLCAEEKSEA